LAKENETFGGGNASPAEIVIVIVIVKDVIVIVKGIVVIIDEIVVIVKDSVVIVTCSIGVVSAHSAEGFKAIGRLFGARIAFKSAAPPVTSAVSRTEFSIGTKSAIVKRGPGKGFVVIEDGADQARALRVDHVHLVMDVSYLATNFGRRPRVVRCRRSIAGIGKVVFVFIATVGAAKNDQNQC
jgi:hypothetical protein